MQKLYEDRLDGGIPETVFKDLLTKYDTERITRKNAAVELEKKLKSAQKNTDETTDWIRLIKRYANLEVLDAQILLTLVDKIIVHEAEIVEGKRIVDIEIRYKYVGDLDWLRQDGEKTSPLQAQIESEVACHV